MQHTKLKVEDANGTSLRAYVNTTYDALVKTFGEPTELGSRDGKVQAEWVLSIEGVLITIYDYKESREVNKVDTWHIGGKHVSVMLAGELVERCLKEAGFNAVVRPSVWKHD